MFSIFDLNYRGFGEHIHRALANNDGDALMQAVLSSALDGPQRFAVMYFDHYFAQSTSNCIEHPLLGNLIQLADEIDRRYPYSQNGINFVSIAIRKGAIPLNECAQVRICI